MSVPLKVKIKRFLLNTQLYKYAKRRYRKLMKETDNKICAVPWMHLNFEPNGKVVPCCLTSTYNYFAGDLTHQTIDQIWNSDNMKNLRVQMMNNEEPEICRKCYDKEKVTGESGRIYHNREFKSVLKKIPIITEKDGTCNEMKLKYWDFRFSNLCNFKCRSCGPRYSSAWVPDAKKLGYTDQEKVWNIDAVGQQTNYDFLKDQVQHVEKIYFAGGEPLLMPEHWQILDMLVEGKRFDVKLSYNTNCSVLEYGKKNVLDYWSQWDYGKLEIWPSIDEIGERAELIRSGTIWPKVEENLIAMTKLDNLIVRPGLTIGAMNVFRLPEIIDKLLELGVIKEKLWYKNFFINLLEQPSYYHVHILPDEFKDSIIDRINGYIEEYNKKYSTDIGPHFAQIIHELKKPHNPKDAIKFLRTSYQVDQVRDESIFDTIPELECLRNMYPGKYR
jgi:radical SAM protein with 4Fe4S-binding SPASM domain